MKISDLFKKPIDRNIDGVIHVDKTDEELISHELEEYIVTDELNGHFRTFFNALEAEEKGKNGHIWVWIQGFYGSWKSHFLKILAYLLSDKEIKWKLPRDYFEDKFNWIDLRTSLKEFTNNHDIDVILFDVDTKASEWVKTISEICINKFFQYLWFCKTPSWLAYQEWLMWDRKSVV